ncbi:MAG: glycosyltransferase, partial [Ktedonobacterales bacterium]|nr:glycosyltransferase [Ktedonobacterales bacterium]
MRFFRQHEPPQPVRWPTVTLLQPITRGASELAANLCARLALDYPASVRHLLICDAQDRASRQICEEVLAAHPGALAEVVLVPVSARGAVASKIGKLNAALPRATGDVLCFVDDDVRLRPESLRVLVTHLGRPRAGAVFGLACYTSWGAPWSALMSAFVNASALLSYIPLSFLTEPFTITGHCFALRRADFVAAGGFDGLEARVDDDHELARRLGRLGLRC